MCKQRQQGSRAGYGTVSRLHLNVSLVYNEQTTKLRQALPSIVGTLEAFYTLAQLALSAALTTEMIRALRTHPASEPPTRLARGETTNHGLQNSRVLQGTSNRAPGKRRRGLNVIHHDGDGVPSLIEICTNILDEGWCVLLRMLKTIFAGTETSGAMTPCL
jgi:hypothetical protein